MIIQTEEDLDKKKGLDVPKVHTHHRNASSLSLRIEPPPVHPALYDKSAERSPPVYQITKKPLKNTTYTFYPNPSQWNGMTLQAPADLDGPYPSYHISVRMNCFTPTSYITTIRRESEYGEYVGDFEMGLTTSKKPATLCLRGNEHPLADVLKAGYQPFRSQWFWKTLENERSVSLYWDDSAPGGALTCFVSKELKTGNHVLAKFVPPVHLRKPGRPVELTKLEVFPQGHDVFDDILMSALILERMRTTPT